MPHRAESTSEELSAGEMIARLSAEIRRRGLTAPAVVLLELLRPLGVVAGQLLLVFEPVLSPFIGQAGRQYACFLERDDNLLGLVRALQEGGDSHPLS